jgi:predicted ferric reductase
MHRAAGKDIAEIKILSQRARFALGIICILSVLGLLATVSSVPFVFESRSILYKLGSDKTFLRTGKIIGIIAATLLLLQLSLSSRIKLLDNIFALNRLYLFHRVNAVVVAVLAVVHPLLVFAPEDISSIPVELKYWPEVLGAFLLLLIWLITASGLWRLFLDFSFHRWWLFHRIAAFAAVVMLIFHVLSGSETFESGLPRLIVFLTASIYAIVFGWVKIKPLLIRNRPYSVTNVKKAGQDTYAVEVTPQRGSIFKYVPGQFAFISFKSENLSSEEHPFTISSTPSQPQSLQFLIRCSGDWTGLIGCLKSGDTAYIDGPYGRFSYLFINSHSEYVMIAGGIGITPMLSMLRYMADVDETGQVTLIWSNRTREDIVFADEFADLEQRLQGLRVHHIFTRQPDSSGIRGRLNKDKLDSLLSGCNRQVPVFICGPPLMMDEVRKGLIKTGFSPALIHTEEFSL